MSLVYCFHQWSTYYKWVRFHKYIPNPKLVRSVVCLSEIFLSAEIIRFFTYNKGFIVNRHQKLILLCITIKFAENYSTCNAFTGSSISLNISVYWNGPQKVSCSCCYPSNEWKEARPISPPIQKIISKMQIETVLKLNPERLKWNLIQSGGGKGERTIDEGTRTAEVNYDRREFWGQILTCKKLGCKYSEVLMRERYLHEHALINYFFKDRSLLFAA